MRMATVATAAMIVGAITLASAGVARAQSCDDLWYERNAIYKDAGYCFKTRRAIATFGNAGCQYDAEEQVPLARGQRARIASIVRMERELGCR
jgi:YARHG domain-containing protein